MGQGDHERSGIGSDTIPLKDLPKTTIQAIYHAVTGKTENLSRALNGNVKISSSDIERLYQMMFDQLGHYDLETNPTVTIIVKTEDSKTFTYSSWERYLTLSVANYEVTSSVIMKIEFLINLPNTISAQRCVINIDIDSALPMINRRSKLNNEIEEFGLFILLSQEWRTVDVSIDFVDYMLAKIFCTVIEEWFGTLAKIETSWLNRFLFRRHSSVRSLFLQGGRIGMASFLASLLLFKRDVDFTLQFVVLSVSIGIFVWASFSIFETFISGIFFKRISANIIPSVILLSEKDIKSFNLVESRRTDAHITIFGVIITIVMNICINIFSSYLYSKISGG